MMQVYNTRHDLPPTRIASTVAYLYSSLHELSAVAGAPAEHGPPLSSGRPRATRRASSRWLVWSLIAHRIAGLATCLYSAPQEPSAVAGTPAEHWVPLSPGRAQATRSASGPRLVHWLV